MKNESLNASTRVSQRFSLRKVAGLGAVSALVGLAFLGFSNPVLAEGASANVSYQYVTTDELTDQEKAEIIQALPETVKENAQYYVVYRPVKSHTTATALPQTGSGETALAGLLGAGIILLGVPLLGKKKIVAGMVGLGLVGGLVVVTPVSALTVSKLAQYGHTEQLSLGSALPDGKIAIAGYEFVGYLKGETSSVNVAGESKKTNQTSPTPNPTAVVGGQEVSVTPAKVTPISSTQGMNTVVPTPNSPTQETATGTTTPAKSEDTTKAKDGKAETAPAKETPATTEEAKDVKPADQAKVETPAKSEDTTEAKNGKAETTPAKETPATAEEAKDVKPAETTEVTNPQDAPSHPDKPADSETVISKEETKPAETSETVEKGQGTQVVSTEVVKTEPAPAEVKPDTPATTGETVTTVETGATTTVPAETPAPSTNEAGETVTTPVQKDQVRVDTETRKTPINPGRSYVIDEGVPIGEERVITKGQFGELTEVYKVTYTNGVVTDRVLVDSIRKEGVHELIAVNPFSNSTIETYQVTESIDFDTIIREVDDLAEGEEREVQAGVKGTRVIEKYRLVATNGATKDTGEEKEVSYTAPTPRIVERGRAKASVIETKEVRESTDLDPNMEFIDTDDLPVGTIRLSQPGAKGYVVNSYTVTTKDGVEISRSEPKEVERVEPVNIVYLRGTKFEDKIETKVEKSTETIKAGRIDQPSADLYKDEEPVLSKPGKDGVINYETTVTYTNGVETDRSEKKEVSRVEAEDAVYLYGTKERPVETTETTTEREVIKFETEYRGDPLLDEGKEEVEVQGQDGYIDYQVTTKKVDGQVVDTVKTEVSRVEAVKAIIRYGTRQQPVTTVKTIEEAIAYETITRKNANLAKGVTKKVQDGKNGVRYVEVTSTPVGGQVVETKKTISEVPATPEIIEEGTKEDIREDIRIERETLNYEEVQRANDSMFKGDVKEVQKGEKGSVSTTYKDTYVNGELTKTEVVGEPHRVEAKDHIIEYGTRDVVSTSSIETTEPIQFGTTYEDDYSLEIGKFETKSEGQMGERLVLVTRTVNNKTGEVSETKDVIKETPAVNEVVRKGMKPKAAAATTKTTVSVDEFVSMTEEQQDAFLAGKKNYVVGESVKIDKATQATLDKLETTVNIEKLNQKLVELINQERATKNLSPVSYAGVDSSVQRVATLRANEMADHGSLRYNGYAAGKHKRPDGSSWSTAYSEAEQDTHAWRGENAAQTGTSLGANISNEDNIAEMFFDLWKDSPSHYAAMMKKKNNIQVAIGVALGARTLKDGVYDNPANEYGLTIGMLEFVQYKN